MAKDVHNDIRVEKVENFIGVKEPETVQQDKSVPQKRKRSHVLNMRELKEKIPDVKIAGHPANCFSIACRISSEDQNFYRSLDVGPVEGGGAIIQSAWFENGRPAVAMMYSDKLAVEYREYHNGDEVIHKGPILVRRRPDKGAFWKWIRNYVFRAVFCI